MHLDRQLAYLLLGSNMGDSVSLLEEAIQHLNSRAGTVTAQSAFYRTSAWGVTEQPDFINCAVAIETVLTASELLVVILAIETDLGRVRQQQWGSRTMDIDLIFYGTCVIDQPKLVVPHPQMQNRSFVLVPLAEIAAEFLHPTINQTVKTLLSNVSDALPVVKLSKHDRPYKK